MINVPMVLRRFLRSSTVFLFVTGLLILAGCDSNAGGNSRIGITREISLDADGNPILFIFSEADAATGRLQDISCDCKIDIGPFLTEQGFSKADIVSASITAASIVMAFPISENLNFLETAILKLQTDGVSATEVASQSGFSDSRESTLQTLPNRDVSAFLERTDFNAILQINPAALQSGETYKLGLIFTIQLEMQAK